MKQLQELRDDVSDFKSDMIEDWKGIKFRLHMIELTGDPLTARLDRMNDLLRARQSSAPDRALLARLRQRFGEAPRAAKKGVSAIR